MIGIQSPQGTKLATTGFINSDDKIILLSLTNETHQSIFHMDKYAALTLIDDLLNTFKFKYVRSKESELSKPTDELPTPPLGIMPQYLYIEKRMKDIMKATERYMIINQQVPDAWIIEYSQLAKQYKELTSKISPSL